MFGLIAGAAIAESPSTAVHQGNALYGQGKFGDAVKKYDQAAGIDPSLLESLYDKANGCYRLDDLAGAADLYKSVAAQSRDAGLVEKAKYNLGNCAFRQALKLKDSEPQKALEGIKAGIGSWRQVLDMDPQNQNAARNIEVAHLTMKDIMDQQKQKQQDPNKSQKNDQKNQDPNQQNQNQQQNQQGKQDPNQQNQQQIKKAVQAGERSEPVPEAAAEYATGSK
jgi:Ca-activated chloride channel family protein